MTELAADQGGATAIEYALIGTLISIVVVASLTTIGTTLNGFMSSVNAHL